MHEEGFVDFFNGVGLFGQNGGKRVQADRAALIFFDDSEQELAVDFVEAVLIYFQHLQRGLCGGQVDFAGATDLRIIPHAPQQAVGDTRCAARAAGNLGCARGVDFHSQNLGGAFHDHA